MMRIIGPFLAVTIASSALALHPNQLPAQEPTAAEADDSRPPSRGVRSRIRELVRGADEEPGALEHEAGARTARLRKGWIAVVDLLRFIEDSTGRPVVYPSVPGDPSFGADAGIHFLADQEEFDAATARFYLERNGYELAGEEIADGRTAIVVTARMARTAMTRTVPSADLVIGPGEPLPALPPESRAMLVLALGHADSGSVAQALRELLSLSPAATTQIVAVPAAAQVIAVAPIETLRTIRELVELLDVETAQPRKAAPSPEQPSPGG